MPIFDSGIHPNVVLRAGLRDRFDSEDELRRAQIANLLSEADFRNRSLSQTASESATRNELERQKLAESVRSNTTNESLNTQQLAELVKYHAGELENQHTQNKNQLYGHLINNAFNLGIDLPTLASTLKGDLPELSNAIQDSQEHKVQSIVNPILTKVRAAEGTPNFNDVKQAELIKLAGFKKDPNEPLLKNTNLIDEFNKRYNKGAGQGLVNGSGQPLQFVPDSPATHHLTPAELSQPYGQQSGTLQLKTVNTPNFGVTTAVPQTADLSSLAPYRQGKYYP